MLQRVLLHFFFIVTVCLSTIGNTHKFLNLFFQHVQACICVRLTACFNIIYRLVSIFVVCATVHNSSFVTVNSNFLIGGIFVDILNAVYLQRIFLGTRIRLFLFLFSFLVQLFITLFTAFTFVGFCVQFFVAFFTTLFFFKFGVFSIVFLFHAGNGIRHTFCLCLISSL